jgi:hypothetical protein
MCFSATASFGAAAVLTPVGLAAVQIARRRDPSRWLPLAFTPLLFAPQQAVEGLVWLGFGQGQPADLAELRSASLAYLWFAFALWPVWIPWSALRICGVGGAPWRRRVIRILWGLGLVLALLLWLPLLGDPARITPVLRHGSIDYQVILPGSALVSHGLVTLVYGTIICLPLLLTTSRRVWLLAAALALAFAVAQLGFLYAFSSVWCYFSAVLSALVVWILLRAESPARAHAPALIER